MPNNGFRLAILSDRLAFAGPRSIVEPYCIRRLQSEVSLNCHKVMRASPSKSSLSLISASNINSKGGLTRLETETRSKERQ